MKKFTAMALAMLMGVGVLAGCGGSTSPSSSSGSAAPQNRLEKILQSGKLHYVTSPDFAPYEFIDLTKIGQGQDQYIGADIALAGHIATELGVELFIEAMDYDAVLTAVSEGKCDIAIAGIAPKPDRQTKMDFTTSYSPPKDTEGQSLMIRKADAEKFRTLEDFNKPEIKLAVQNASLQQSLAEEQIPNATQVPITKLSDGVLELQQGKVDALVIPTTTGTGYAGSYDNLQMSGIFLQYESDGPAAAVPKGEAELVEKLNEIIEGVLEQGLYLQWEAEYSAIAAQQQEDSKK